MAGPQSTASDPYQAVTDQIVELLEQGTAPWRNPWASVAPRNLLSGRPYRGINPFMLARRGFSSPFWLTPLQARQVGGHVLKRERPTLVLFWRVLEMEGDGGEAVRLPFRRLYRVFNLEQTEGIPTERVPRIEAGVFEPIGRAEAIVQRMPRPPAILHGATGAWYEPERDIVHLPDPGHFSPPEAFYSALFHELCHAAGHASRLASGNSEGVPRFGSPGYCRQELVAEMGAAFLCGLCRIGQATVENSAAYIQGWLKKLRGDRKLVVVAAAQAQKTADFILGFKHDKRHRKGERWAKNGLPLALLFCL